MNTGDDWRALLDEHLDVFFGQATDIEARVYATLPKRPELAGLRLSGVIQGPYSKYARTLPATMPFVSRAGQSDLLAEVVVPDPCFWTPESPSLYRCEIALHDGERRLAQCERAFGIRPLGVKGGNLFLQGKRWVLRGMAAERVEAASLDAWREQGAAMFVESPTDQLCREASEIGVLLVARIPTNQDGSATRSVQDELRRLARWPAVGMAILADEPREFPKLAGAARNLVMTTPLSADHATAATEGCHLVNAEWFASHKFTELPGGPVLVQRSLASARDLAAARVECDRLQRDLAPVGQFAGYVV